MVDVIVPQTPDEVDALMKDIAKIVMALGDVDWNDLVRQDETPATGHTRVTVLVNAAGMFGSMAMAAMVPMEDLFTGMVAAAIEGAQTKP